LKKQNIAVHCSETRHTFLFRLNFYLL